MKKVFGIGIVGYGFIGKVHAYAYRNMLMYYPDLPCDFKLVGVCDVNEQLAKDGAEKEGFEFWTDDYRELLARDDIHVIHCCTPNLYHRELLIEAAKAGKHLYSDKPLAISLTESLEILEAVRQAGVKHQMGLEYRFIPAIMRAKQLIDEGFLGTPFSFHSQYLHSGYIDPLRPISWRLDVNVGCGGALLDMGPHPIDLARFLLGDFAEVSAVTETYIKERPVKAGSTEMREVKVDDMGLIQAKLKNGAIGVIETSRIATGTNDELRLEIHGSQGAISFNLMEPNWLSIYDCRDKAEPIGGDRGFKKIETVQRYPQVNFPGPKFAVGWIRYHIASVHDFLLSLSNNAPTSSSFEDGVAIQKIIDRAYQSAREKKWMDCC